MIILAIIFGISAWLGTNSVFVQMPLLIENAPERWSLPSYMIIAAQIANIGPLMYTLMQKFSKKKLNDVYIIYLLLFIGAVSALALSFLYDKTTIFGNKERSLSLLILVSCFALVGCTSSVLFIPYMGRFREIYLITYLLGEGLSGLIIAGVALIQGSKTSKCQLVISVNGTQLFQKATLLPLFGPHEFFLVTFVLMCCSFTAFALLDQLKSCKKEHVAIKINKGDDYAYDENDNNDKGKKETGSLSMKQRLGFTSLMSLMCMFGNTLLPSIESFSCLPYSNKIYHFNVIFRLISNPIVCFLAIFLPHKSFRSIYILSGFSGIMTSYVIFTAIKSPYPPLVNSAFGGPLLIIIWTFLFGSISYVKLSINCIMRSQGGKSLVWIGAASQVGSLTGSVLIFNLIKHTNIFTAYEEC